ALCGNELVSPPPAQAGAVGRVPDDWAGLVWRLCDSFLPVRYLGAGGVVQSGSETRIPLVDLDQVIMSDSTDREMPPDPSEPRGCRAAAFIVTALSIGGIYTIFFFPFGIWGR